MDVLNRGLPRRLENTLFVLVKENGQGKKGGKKKAYLLYRWFNAFSFQTGLSPYVQEQAGFLLSNLLHFAEQIRSNC